MPSTNRGGFRGRNGCREGSHRGRGTRGQAPHNRGSNNARHPYKKNTSDQTDGPQSKPCYICESTDHFAAKCPNLSKLQEMLNSSDQSANLAIGATIIDSGATQHMFHQLDDLSGDITQNKSTITCANLQTLRSTHVRSVNLMDCL